MRSLVVRVGVYPHQVTRTTAWEAATLAAAGVEYQFNAEASPEAQIEALSNADVILTSGHAWPAEILAHRGRCRALVCCGVGVDRIDVDAATASRIMVCNMPDLCTDEVADHALALMLACVRKVPQLHQRVVSGTWDRQLLEPMPRLRGKRLGLLGFGRIGRAVADRAKGFGLVTSAQDSRVPADDIEAAGVSPSTFKDVLAASDIVSCHVPLTDQTRGLINEAALRAMQPTAYLINTSRGGLIDEQALTRALSERWIAGAGLDVLAAEPPPPGYPLLQLDNLIVTSHAGGFSNEVVDLIPRMAVDEALAIIRGGTPRPIAWINRAAFVTIPDRADNGG